MDGWRRQPGLERTQAMQEICRIADREDDDDDTEVVGREACGSGAKIFIESLVIDWLAINFIIKFDVR